MTRTNLATSEPVSIAPVDDTQRLMAIAIEQGEAGVAALERLVAMRERAEDRASERAYAAAMRAAQSEIQPVAAKKKNTQTNSKYADLFALHGAIVPIYTKHGFALSYDEGESPRGDGWVRILCDVTHEAGHTTHKHIDLPLDDKGMAGKTNKTALHAIGSTISYGRRYIALMAFNVATFDDDGNTGGKDDQYITAEQAATLKALAQEVKADIPRFLKWAQAASFAEVKASNYATAVKMLEAKR